MTPVFCSNKGKIEKWKKHNCRSHTHMSYALRVSHTFHRPVIPAWFKKRVGALSVVLLNGKHTLACPDRVGVDAWVRMCGCHEPCPGGWARCPPPCPAQQQPALMDGLGLTGSQPCVVCVCGCVASARPDHSWVGSAASGGCGITKWGDKWNVPSWLSLNWDADRFQCHI